MRPIHCTQSNDTWQHSGADETPSILNDLWYMFSIRLLLRRSATSARLATATNPSPLTPSSPRRGSPALTSGLQTWTRSAARQSVIGLSGLWRTQVDAGLSHERLDSFRREAPEEVDQQVLLPGLAEDHSIHGERAPECFQAEPVPAHG